MNQEETTKNSKPRVAARGLGRGLSALFEEARHPDEPDSASQIQFVAIDQLTPGVFQPRRSFDEEALAALAESIKAQGILQPLLVRPLAGQPARYEIIAGERRWRAAQSVPLMQLPVLVRMLDDHDSLQVALIENIQRQDLSPLEEAEAYYRLIEEFGHTQEVLARGIGKSRSHVANMLRLLTLPASVRRLLEEGKISAGHARVLITCSDAEQLAQEIVEKGLSVRSAENRAKTIKNPREPQAASDRAGNSQEPDSELAELEQNLWRLLGLKVTIEKRERGGAVIIEYRSATQLDDIIQRLNQGTV